MITIYLTYAQPMKFYDCNEFGRTIPAGEERRLIKCENSVHAAVVTESWLRDPDTISVRIVKEAQAGV